MADIFDQIAEKRKISSSEKKMDIFDQIAKQRQVPTSLGIRAGKEFASSLLGSYGDIANLAGLNQETPGSKLRREREAKASPEELIYHVEDDVIPSYGRLPQSEELLTAFGGVTPAEKPIERLISRSAKAAGAGGALGGASAVFPAITGATIGQGSQELGAPESVGTGLEIATSIGSSLGKSALSSAKKSSGLTERQFEKLVKPRNVTPERFSKIINTVENEARDISDNILNTSKTRIAMKEFPDFNRRVEQGFEKVKDIAKELPNEFSGSDLVKDFNKKARERLLKGFPESAAEKTYRKEMKYLIQKNVGKDFSAEDLVNQYRENNKSLSGMFDKNVSSNINEAKKQAILDFQEVIRSEFDKQLPNTEFTNLFKFTNKQYSDASKIRVVEDYLDKVFTGEKINFKAAQNYFDKNKVKDAMKSVYGKESADAFSNLQKDLLSYEDGMKLIKAAENKNINLKDYGYLLIPPVGITKIGKKLYDRAVSSVLDKPQTLIKWDQALKDIRKGSFNIGARKLEEVAKEFENSIPQMKEEREDKKQG